ncbi:unnamed protein product [Blepharisma stoltei]|uniref:Diphthine--ammonia ligase n=1 Tax=Blepharisma stoltei TaxID=1481888 RepID=A0AAU9JGQ1_9CILI|nr:unnamed protein product [Blepharisma stoltei]
MKFVALLSGGKDSLYALAKALEMGHELVCVANLYSASEEDSYMFQTVGTTLVPAIAKSLGTNIVTRRLIGKSINKESAYIPTENDEIEDLFKLIQEAKYRYPQIDSVVSGAVLSDYQRARVENICSRLGLSSIAPLWRMDQRELLIKMVEEGFDSILIKISSMGLGKEHLGQRIADLISYFDGLKKKYGFNMCGEGGEYESLILDAPIMKYKIVIESSEVVTDKSPDYSPYGHLQITGLSLLNKETGEKEPYCVEAISYPKLFRNIEEFYTPELDVAAFGMPHGSIEHEAFLILKGLEEILEIHGFSMKEIYYVVVFIKDMRNFAAFNAVYSKFFNFPNPPSRVLCEYANQSCQVKLMVKGTKDAKKCTWVQSISPWAVANIGPYSQSYKVNSCLHMAGVIPLVPSTMQIATDQVSQTFKNCEAVAEINGFKLEESEMCVVYYAGEKPDIDERYNPFWVKPTGIPRNCALELEFHLQKDMPAFTAQETELEGYEFKATIKRREIKEFTYFYWYLTIENDENTEGLIEALKEELDSYFSEVRSKSPSVAEQLLGAEPISVKIEDYIADLRIFSTHPNDYKSGWLLNVPCAFIDSETNGILIYGSDPLQLATYHFINNS